MLEPEVEPPMGGAARPRRQGAIAHEVAYIFERSALYRGKLGAAGISSPEEAGGLGDIARLPLTEKSEVKATATRGEPDRHPPLRRARRDRPHLLDERYGNAEPHPAHRG